MIVCPCCAAVLRKIPGLHQEGEPYLCTDAGGSFFVCMQCETRVPWSEQEPGGNDDFDGDAAFA